MEDPVEKPVESGQSSGVAGAELSAEGLERQVAELEGLSQRLSQAQDEELPGLLERAVELVDEINAGIEDRLAAASAESGEAEGLLDRVDFGPFDAALGSLERESPAEPEAEER